MAKSSAQHIKKLSRDFDKWHTLLEGQLEGIPMDKVKVYTLGYLGRTQDDLAAIVERLDAKLLDIRFSPFSRNQQFAGWALKRRLTDQNYQHIKPLGNVNYKNGGPIEIADFPAGLEVIRQSVRPVILMCACRDAAGCHRTVVAKMLQDEGFTVEEIPLTQNNEANDAGRPVQQALFD